MITLLDAIEPSKIERLIETLLTQGTHLGIAILKAIIVFTIGKLLINLINKFVKRVMERRGVVPSVRTFVGSLVNVTLIILLIVSVIGALGIQTTSFAALLASAGVAIGMALSGNLANFAGGLIILLFKPFKVGDYIGTSSVSGTVREIQIFHTIITTSDNIKVYVPNGTLSSNYVKNYNIERRRAEWIIGIEYGEDYDKVRQVIADILTKNENVMKDPAPAIVLHALDSSSVNIRVRAWAKGSYYWGVYFGVNEAIYKTFNEKGIEFPFPQLTIHQAEN